MKGIIQKAIVPVLGGLCVVSLIAMVLVLTRPQKEPEFAPPAFDSAAQEGAPKVPEGIGWQELHQEGMTYKVGLCGKVLVKDQKADLYFYNAKANDVWIKLRIFDSKDQIIAETGLIKPNEYIQSVSFATEPKEGETLRIKVMGYEPETYHSAGSITINTIVGG